MLIDLFAVSLTMSVIIILLLIISPFISSRYKAKCKYLAWLFIAIRLLIPFRIDPPEAPLKIQDNTIENILETPITFETETPVQHTSDNTEENSEKQEVTTEPSKIKSISLSTVIFSVWLTVAILFIIYHLIVLMIFQIKTNKNRKHIKDNVYSCSYIDSPMMTGFFKPTILVPEIDLTDEELDLIILHESTHFKRKDIWYKFILIVANAMHWFNPLIYIMLRNANRDLEYSCDDIVTKNMNLEQKKLYSKTILKFIKQK